MGRSETVEEVNVLIDILEDLKAIRRLVEKAFGSEAAPDLDQEISSAHERQGPEQPTLFDLQGDEGDDF
jgi:hypothetical protein